MHGEWIEKVLGGTLEVPVPSLTLTKGDSTRFQGSGRLHWKRGSVIRLQANTDGADSLWREFGHRGTAPGQLFGPSAYVTLSGCSSDDMTVSASPVLLGDPDIYVGQPHVIWNLALRDLRLAGPGYPPRGREIRALMDSGLPLWPRMTDVRVTNEYFGGKSGRRDWLKADTAIGTIAARARTDECCEVQVGTSAAGTIPCAEDVLSAIAAAFGFVTGRRAAVLAYEEWTPGDVTQALNAQTQRQRRDAIPTPIGNAGALMNGVESLLGRASDYFLTEQGKKVVDHLYLCWDAAGRAFPTQQLVTSICVDGLLRIASMNSAESNAGLPPTELATVRDWLSRNPDGLSARTISRLEGLVGSLNRRRPTDILRDWCDRGLLGVTRDDVSAWESTRNLAAHAEFVGPMPARDDLQQQVSALTRVQNLMNRIVLQLVGYRGLYIDHASRDWAETEFPSVSGDVL